MLKFEYIKVIFNIFINKFVFNLINNLKQIKTIYKFTTFIIFIPLIFYIIKIQFYIGFIFFTFYILYFSCFFFIKSPFNIECKETYLNTSHIYRYALYNIFIQIPKSYGYFFFYQTLLFFNKTVKYENKFSYLNILIFTVMFFIIFIYKYTFLFIVGYSYLSIIISSNFTIIIFRLLNFKYENNKAVIETLIINCIINYCDMINKVEKLKISYNEDFILKFNFYDKIFSILKNFKKPELIINSINDKNFKKNIDVIYYNNHFTATQQSIKYKDKNISTNYTSNKEFNIIYSEKNNEKLLKQIILDNPKNPNFIGENKANYLTPPHEINFDVSKIKNFPKKYLIKSNELKEDAFNHLLKNKNSLVLYSENGIILKKEDAPNLVEYSKEYELPIYNQIKNIIEFEKINENYLNTEKGKQEFQLFENYFKNYIYDNN